MLTDIFTASDVNVGAQFRCRTDLKVTTCFHLPLSLVFSSSSGIQTFFTASTITPDTGDSDLRDPKPPNWATKSS